MGHRGIRGAEGGWGKGQWPPIKREEKEGDECKTRTRMGTIYNHTWINHTQKKWKAMNQHLTFWLSFIFQICTKLSSTRFSASTSATVTTSTSFKLASSHAKVTSSLLNRSESVSQWVTDKSKQWYPIKIAVCRKKVCSDWWWSSVHTLIVPRWSPRGPKAVVKCSQMVPFGPNVFAPCFQIGPWIPKVAPKRFWATEQRPGDPKIVPGASYPQGIVAWSVLGQDGFKRSFCVVLKY